MSCLVLLGIGVVGGCAERSGGEDGREPGYAGFIEAEVELTSVECECLADPDEAQVCFDERDAYAMAEQAIAPCMDEALADMPEARQILQCQADAFARYPGCIENAGGCAVYDEDAGYACDDVLLDALIECGEIPPEVDEAHVMCSEDIG
jgi:hypothetical protein